MNITYGKGFEHLGQPLPSVRFDLATGSFVDTGATDEERREYVMNLTRHLLMLPDEQQLDFRTEHAFLNGMYMRTIYIPKGSFIAGKVHRLDCMNIVASGDISILTETGAGRVKAGFTAISPAGLQKIGYAHEDTVFINVFRTDETDVGKIDEVVAWPSYEAAGMIQNTVKEIT